MYSHITVRLNLFISLFTRAERLSRDATHVRISELLLKHAYFLENDGTQNTELLSKEREWFKKKWSSRKEVRKCKKNINLEALS